MRIEGQNLQAIQQVNVAKVEKKEVKQLSTSMIEKKATGFAAADKLDKSSGAAVSSTVTNNVNIESNVSVEQNVYITNVFVNIPGSHSMLRDVSGAVTAGNAQVACGKFESFVKDIHDNGMPVDVNALVQQVLRESYLDTTEDLKFYADKVKYFNEAKKMTRQYVQDLRDFKTGLSTFMKDNDFCLSDPPSDKAQLAKFNELVETYCAQHIGTAKHATGNINVQYAAVTSMVNDIAKHQAIGDVLNRGDKMIKDTFGCGLPQEIKDHIKTALTSGNDEVINAAMKEVAQYVSYLGDAAVKDGKFGKASNGIDDVSHKKGCSSPCYEDFQYYMTSDSNKSARSNLSCTGGDQAQIMKAFGFDSSVNLTTYTSFDKVVETAMSPLHDAWKNEVLIGQEKTTDAIYQDIMKNGNSSEWAKAYPGIVQKVVENSTQNNQMADDIGLPSTIPPTDVTTVEELDNAITKFEEKLSTIGDDAQLANTDLQNILQKQQQTLQMMSNISKMLSDTALAVIRKIG